jgi:thiol:disulfide interchange protein
MQIKRVARLGVLPALAAMTLTATNARAADIKWHSSLPAAQAEAKKTKRPILVYFSTTWCGPCKEMKRTTFKDAKVVAESRKWTMVQIDAEKQEKVAAKYKVDGYPTTIILKPNGAGVARAEGGMSASGFLKWMKSKYAAAKK